VNSHNRVYGWTVVCWLFYTCTLASFATLPPINRWSVLLGVLTGLSSATDLYAFVRWREGLRESGGAR
jgi:hypothetical protein